MNKNPSMKGVQTRTLNILELLAKHADGLALAAIELVRLSVVDGERLTWVARAQGARQGLRYDPDMGTDARFSCSSTGWAWLSTFNDKEALKKASDIYAG